MDETTFQHELHALKVRVANMTARHVPSSLHSSYGSSAGDGFTVQVDDIKQHIARLEQGFHMVHGLQPQASQQGTVQPRSLRLAQPLCTPQSVHQVTYPYDQSLHMYYSLRSDMERVNSRCLEVERTVSELEDKLESLDPYRFTPPSSDSSADEGVGLHPVFDDFRERSYKPVPSPYLAPAQTTPGLEFNNSPAPSTVANEGPTTPRQVAEGLLQAKLDASNVTLDILRKYSSKMDGAAPLLNEDAGIVRAIVKLHTKLAADHSWNAARLQDDARSREAPNARRTSVTASELDAPESYPPRSEELPVPLMGPVRAEGVAFRDQEISRLEELLGDAQDTAALTEETLCRDRQAHHDLQERYENCTKQNAYLHDLYLQRDAEVCKSKEKALQREVHLQQLNDYLHTRDEQRERYSENHRQVLERSREQSAIIQSCECQIKDLNEALYDCRKASEKGLDEMRQARDEEIGRLQHFCEQKDAVAQRQEHIIARGARLLEQRDAEIEKLSRRVNALRDDNALETKQRQLTSKLLEERDSELMSLKNRSAVATESAPHTHSCEPEMAEREEASPFFAKRHTSWSPRPIPDDRRLPSEAHRASAWERGTAQPRAEFGKPSPIGHRRHLDQPPRRRRSSPHPRKIRYLIDGQLVDADEDGKPSLFVKRPEEHPQTIGSPAIPEGQPSNRRYPTGRHSLPMDRTVWPPLPAPTANKMQSLADLRSAARSEQLRRVVKHQSMQELKRREHQAYVETEGESGGEFGGGA